jgi:putative effector of murein hydrolase
MMVLAAYLTRGLQLLLGSSKRAETARAEELGEEMDEIPMVESTPQDTEPPSASISTAPSSLALNDLALPSKSQLPQLRPQDDRDTSSSQDREAAVVESGPIYSQQPLPAPRAQRWSAIISARLDWIMYGAIFIFVGFPVYYGTGYAMPLQLSLGILAYFAAMEIPPNWRQYLHPVLVSSLLTVLGIWVLATIRGDSLHTALTEYRTGTSYLQLWERSSRGILPGAGDVFGTILDASIVSLALPMYQYRRELKEHFAAIVIPNVLISVGSLFSYPYICFAIGIGASRSLAFAARSLTLALAVPAAQNLGGDVNTVAALAITSGILGVLVGQRMFAWLKIPDGESRC